MSGDENYKHNEDTPLRHDEGGSAVAMTEFVESPPTAERFVFDQDGNVFGKIVSNAPPQFIDRSATCWFCKSGSGCDGATPGNELFCPCDCYTPIHRECFRRWRGSWMNPRNYFGCPTCGHSYQLQQVLPGTDASRARVVRAYRIAILKIWLVVILGFAGLSMAVGGIGYGADKDEKNIPVAVKCLLTSVISGFPNSNSTTEWREDFKRPEVPVWPYYSLLGIFVTSLVVLIAFLFTGCSFDENDRRRRGHCTCCDDCCDGTNGCVWMCYDPCPTSHIGSGDGTQHCDCTVNGGGCNGDCGNCNSSGSSGDCGDAGAILAVLVIVIIAIVIFSAIVVLILAMIQRCSLLYDRMTDMVRQQELEREHEVIVLGMHETWKPNEAITRQVSMNV